MNKKFISGILTLALAAGVCPAGLAESSGSEERLAHRLQTQITVPYNRDGFATSNEINDTNNYGTDKNPVSTGTLWKTSLPYTKTDPDVDAENYTHGGARLAFASDMLNTDRYSTTENTFSGEYAKYRLGDLSSDSNVYAAESGGIEINRAADKLSVLIASGVNNGKETSIGSIDITYEGATKAEQTYFLIPQVLNEGIGTNLYTYSESGFIKVNGSDRNLTGKSEKDITLNCLADGAEVLVGTSVSFAKAARLKNESNALKDGVASEIVVDVDPTRTIEKIEIKNVSAKLNNIGMFNCKADDADTTVDESESPNAEHNVAVSAEQSKGVGYVSAYIPVKVAGVDNKVYYMKVIRRGSATLAVTALSEALSDRVTAADAKIADMTEYSADVWNEVQALIEEGALESDFSNYARLTELREAEVYGKRISTYADIEYDKNAYAKWAEVSNSTNYTGTTANCAPSESGELYGIGVGKTYEYPQAFVTDGMNGGKTLKSIVGENWDENDLILTTENAEYKMGSPYKGAMNVLSTAEDGNLNVSLEKKAGKLAVLLAGSDKKTPTVNKITVNYDDNTSDTFYAVLSSIRSELCSMLLTRTVGENDAVTYQKADKTSVDVSDMTLQGVKSGVKAVLANDVKWAQTTVLTSTQKSSVVDGYLKEVVLTVDPTKTISSVQVGMSLSERLNTIFDTTAYTTNEWTGAYVPIKIFGDDSTYYLQVGRRDVGLFAVTTLSETLRERVTAANTALNTLMESADKTTEALTEIKTEIDALISEGAVKADFDKYADLEAALSTPIPIAQAITSAKLYGSENNEVTALTAGEYTAKVTMAKKEDMAVILGAFDGSGNMLSAHIMTMTGASENADGSYTISDSFTVPSGTERLTAFAFDSTANIKPLCEAKDF